MSCKPQRKSVWLPPINWNHYEIYYIATAFTVFDASLVAAFLLLRILMKRNSSTMHLILFGFWRIQNALLNVLSISLLSCCKQSNKIFEFMSSFSFGSSKSSVLIWHIPIKTHVCGTSIFIANENISYRETTFDHVNIYNKKMPLLQ